MKKLMFAVSAALCATVGFSDVTSANVVGYVNADTMSTVVDQNKKAFTLMGIPFRGLNATGNISLNDLVFSDAKFNRSPTPVSGNVPDQIWLWVDTGKGVWNYKQFYFKGTSLAAAAWYDVGNTTVSFDSLYPNGIPAGTGFWFCRDTPATPITMTASGEVSSIDRDVTIMRGKFQFVSCPFPMRLKLNDKTMLDASKCAFNRSPTPVSGTTPDQIWLWVDLGNGNWNYKQFYFKGTSAAAAAWYDVGNTTVSFDSLYPDGIPLCAGFWFYSSEKNSGEDYTITFKSPIPQSTAE